MQIVIDIPQGLKDDFEYERWTALTCTMMKDALEKGVVLPKGHGRLIDADDLEVISGTINDWRTEDFVLLDEIEVAPTIIEADREVQDADSD